MNDQRFSSKTFRRLSPADQAAWVDVILDGARIQFAPDARLVDIIDQDGATRSVIVVLQSATAEKRVLLTVEALVETEGPDGGFSRFKRGLRPDSW